MDPLYNLASVYGLGDGSELVECLPHASSPQHSRESGRPNSRDTWQLSGATKYNTVRQFNTLTLQFYRSRRRF